MNPTRETILNRIRTALQTEAHRPMSPTASPVWPTVGPDLEQRFREEFAALKGEMLDSADALAAFLSGAKVCGSDTLRQSGIDSVATGPDVPLLQADIGITRCDCLVAQTGSILISTRSAGGRALSVFPSIHLVIARRDQLVPDLATAMDLLRSRYEGHWPSQLSVITGPSRTSDIEKVLVLGAHGPKRLALHLTP
jgi:L-lactate dehydrogenase complex protein LldG